MPPDGNRLNAHALPMEKQLNSRANNAVPKYLIINQSSELTVELVLVINPSVLLMGMG